MSIIDNTLENTAESRLLYPSLQWLHFSDVSSLAPKKHPFRPVCTWSSHCLPRNRFPSRHGRWWRGCRGCLIWCGNGLKLHRHLLSAYVDVLGVGVHRARPWRTHPTLADLACRVTSPLASWGWDVRTLGSTTVRARRHGTLASIRAGSHSARSTVVRAR